MNKLMSYGVTARALQLLTRSDVLPTEIPSGWFNWQYVQKTDSGDIVVNRLQLLNVDANGDEVETWNKNAINTGYGCVLVYSTQDEPAFTDHLTNLDDSTVIHPISHMPCDSEIESQSEMLVLYCEPEDFFTHDWALVQAGGGVTIDRHGLSEVLLARWWVFGLSLKKWIQQTAEGKPDSVFRNICPDYSPWNHMKAIGYEYPDTKLDLNRSWNKPQKGVWPWSLDNPCTVSDIPALADHGYIAYYPMRQMPCCGIAIDTKGKLHTIGALPTEPDGSWAFDDGSIHQAFEQKAQELLATA